jgi:hypothetical protein
MLQAACSPPRSFSPTYYNFFRLILAFCDSFTLLPVRVPTGALVLIELMVLSIFYLYAFGIVKIKPSSAPGYDASQVRLKALFAAVVCIGFHG